jgi:NADH dehydrogenase
MQFPPGAARIRRVTVTSGLTRVGHPEISVIGDLALCVQDGHPLPGIAPVAMPQGDHAGRRILKSLRGKTVTPFRYLDRGSMATLGRSAAVAQVGPLRLSRFTAWITWLFVHLLYLVEL